MGRRATGFWDDRTKRYYARLGNVSGKSGKRKPFMLCYPGGDPVAFGDDRGVAGAIARRLAEIDAEGRKAGGPTVLEVVTAYLGWHGANGTAEVTIKTHRHMLGPFCRFEHGGIPYGDRLAASIGVADLARMRKAMEAAGAASGYVKNRYASILACWRWAARPVEDREPERMIPSNPLDGLKRPPRSESVEKVIPWPLARSLLRFARAVARPSCQVPPREGWPRLWSPKRDRLRWRLNTLALHLAAISGCRPDEVARMTWDEVNWRDRAAVLRRGKTFKKTGKKRIIALSGAMTRIFRMLHASPGRHPVYVFVPGNTRKVKPPNARELGEWFRGLRDRAIATGIYAAWEGREVVLPPEMTMYWLRHMFQTEGVQVVSVERVAGAVGNSPGIVESTYVHNQAADAHSVAEEVARARRAKGRGRDLSGPSRGPSG